MEAEYLARIVMETTNNLLFTKEGLKDIGMAAASAIVGVSLVVGPPLYYVEIHSKRKESKRIRKAIENNQPPFQDGQLYFPFMRDYIPRYSKK
ncbi:hypothetical protein HYW20_03575 [Candidatus Woesearchaeota archaeon]|nr:hypothetical protein [Candidatus Woesearchaeota archaeon]